MYTTAFDGNIIIIEKFQKVALDGGYVSPRELDSQLSHNLRVTDDNAVNKVLSPKMLEIYNSMIDLINEDKNLSGIEELHLINEVNLKLKGKEAIEMIAIIKATKATIDGLNALDLELCSDNTLRGRREVAQAIGLFACNLASGGIGSVWGSMAGGIAMAFGTGAVMTGGVSIVVGLAVGAAISTLAC